MEQQVDIKAVSGEEIAIAISQEYEKMIQAQINIRALHFEINRRKEAAPKKEE